MCFYWLFHKLPLGDNEDNFNQKPVLSADEDAGLYCVKQSQSIIWHIPKTTWKEEDDDDGQY